MTEDEERELVYRLQQGDAGVAWRLLMTFGPTMHRVAFRITGDADLAEDVVQQAFLRVLEKGERFRGGSLAGWLRAVAVRVALNVRRTELRTAAREAEYVGGRTEAAAESGDPLLRDTLRGEIARLPDLERAVFILTELEGWSHAEVSEALGVSIDSSRQRLLKARQRLRAALHTLRDDHG